jgi:hypothetical protein
LLDDNAVVLGPDVDGGIYLLGICADVVFDFTHFSWETSSLLEDLATGLEQQRFSVAVLESKSDIDTRQEFFLFYNLHRKERGFLQLFQQLRQLLSIVTIPISCRRACEFLLILFGIVRLHCQKAPPASITFVH